jgi:hypothetical protein
LFQPRSTTRVSRFDHTKKRKTRNKEPHRSSRKKRHRPLLVKGSFDPLTFVQPKSLFKIFVCVEEDNQPLS